MKTPKDGFVVSLSVILCGVCLVVPALGRPRPAWPPMPERNLLCALRFNGSNAWEGLPSPPIVLANVALVESWSGWAASLEGTDPVLLALPCVDAQGRTNLAPMRGTISLWVRPATVEEGKPAAVQSLFEVGAWSDKTAVAFWSLQYDPGLQTVSFLAINKDERQKILGPVPWQARTSLWHQVVFTWSYSPPMPTQLYVDGVLAGEGDPVALAPPEPSPGILGFCVGSDVHGGARVAQLDEVWVLGSPKSAEDIAAAYLREAPIADLGPISAAEEEAMLAYWAALREWAALRAGDSTMTLDSPPPPPGGGGGGGTNAPGYSTNAYQGPLLHLAVPVWQGSTGTLTIAGGTAGQYCDIFRTTNLVGTSIVQSVWSKVSNGFSGQSYWLSYQPLPQAFYVLGTPLDSDGDGLTDAWESLISKTQTDSWDTDGDGMADGWEVSNGLNPTNASDAAGDADGDGISNLQEYLNEQQLLRPREPLGPCSRRTPLVISEIMYHPASGGSEFIEIYNSGHLQQKLDGFSLFDPDFGVSGRPYYTFGPGTTIPPGGFVVVSPTNSPPNSLANGGGTIQLRNAQGAVLLNVEYDDEAPWPVEADGAGHSLVLARPSYGENDVRAWVASERRGGSPGQAETSTFDLLRYITINEFLANPVSPARDFIELYNTAPFAIDVGGCVLSDTNTFNNAFVIPCPTIIAPRGFVSWTDQQSGIGLSRNGEAIYFANPDTNRVIDAVVFAAQADGISTGRFPDGGPGFQELSAQSPGGTNSGVLLRNIVINEIMFHPITGDDRDQYIELYNRGSNGQSLANWHIDGLGFWFTNVNAITIPASN